jgi:hypothetical protein
MANNRIKGIIEELAKAHPLLGMVDEVAQKSSEAYHKALEDVMKMVFEATGEMPPEEFKEKHVLVKKRVAEELFGDEGMVTLIALADKETEEISNIWAITVKMTKTETEDQIKFGLNVQVGECTDKIVEKANLMKNE